MQVGGGGVKGWLIRAEQFRTNEYLAKAKSRTTFSCVHLRYMHICWAVPFSLDKILF